MKSASKLHHRNQPSGLNVSPSADYQSPEGCDLASGGPLSTHIPIPASLHTHWGQSFVQLVTVGAKLLSGVSFIKSYYISRVILHTAIFPFSRGLHARVYNTFWL